METFPTLSAGIYDALGNFANTRAVNPILQAPFVAGYVQRSLRATWIPKKFTRTIRGMSAADVTSLETFMASINEGQDPFAWLDVHSGIIYHVYIAMESLPLTYQLDGRTDKYRLDIAFIQYNDSETTSGEFGYGYFGEDAFGE